MKTQKGDTWELVFSDEFNTPGRSFWPGGASFCPSIEVLVVELMPSGLTLTDDPFWQAQDLHPWSTYVLS